MKYYLTFMDVYLLVCLKKKIEQQITAYKNCSY